MAARIGTVTIRRPRVYPMPGGSLDDAVTAFVRPGNYPIMREDDGTTYWVMQARPNRREVETEPLGNGMFVISGGDVPRGRSFELRSRSFTAEEFAGLVRDEARDPESRLGFELDSPSLLG